MTLFRPAGAGCGIIRFVPPADDHVVNAPFAGTVVAIAHAPGETVAAGTPLLVLESMKMEHEIVVEADGRLTALHAELGETVEAGQALATLEPLPADEESTTGVSAGTPEPSGVSAGTPAPTSVSAGTPKREDMALVRERHRLTQDAARPDAVARRHDAGRRTARENVADLIEPGSFVEYGPLLFAAQEARRPRQELMERTPADGLIGGIGRIDGHRAVVMSYDYTVLAGTQGWRNHAKKDRLFDVAERGRLPVVLFAEGGGGRPGDVDFPVIAGLDCRAFELFARLSGLAPLVGIASGYCFAGNAALLGCCDVVIATEGASIGMGGPAMIEGGGLGVVAPQDVGPLDVQWGNGVVDLRVDDDRAAVAAARTYLSYFTDRARPHFTQADPAELRDLIPDNRKRVYDVRRVLETLLDTGSVLELRAGFGRGIVTALARHRGRSLGVVANDPAHLGGAIDSDGADKAARFMQLCDAFGLPILFLADTPGFMVGPDAERTGTVRHVSRLFVTGANLSVPAGTVVLRKGYGLGAQAMAAGGFHAPVFTVGWPTSEFGGMGLEGAVRLGMRRELEAIADPDERQAAYEAMVAAAYERGRAVNMAAYGEIDDAIDPADTGSWIDLLFDDHSSLDGVTRGRAPKRRPHIDTW